MNIAKNIKKYVISMILDEAFAYLELQEEDNTNELLNELPKVKEDVEYAMGEYCFSLNEIAEAVYRLLNPQKLQFDCIAKIINHIWEAYSCNEKPEEFMKREDDNLCKMFKKNIGSKSCPPA